MTTRLNFNIHYCNNRFDAAVDYINKYNNTLSTFGKSTAEWLKNYIISSVKRTVTEYEKNGT